MRRFFLGIMVVFGAFSLGMVGFFLSGRDAFPSGQKLTVTRSESEQDLMAEAGVPVDEVVKESDIDFSETASFEDAEMKKAETTPPIATEKSGPAESVPMPPAPVSSEKHPTEKSPGLVDRLVSFGHEDRSSRDIDTIIVHSSYDALGDDPYSVSGVIEEYRKYGVAAHYLIDRKGAIYRLVEDRDVAYHAGVSTMPDGRAGVNAFSIGIEILEKDTDSPTSSQYASLSDLVAFLKSEYPIRYVLGHSDIAPGRKTDPWGFDWEKVK